MEYTRQQIIEKCQMAFNDAKTFYQADIVNYRGKSSDTSEYYTEIIAEFLCNNIEDYKTSIPMITRKASYKTASHTGRFSENSNRAEEIVAIKMFNQSNNGCIYDFIGEIIDYQTPLKSSRKDVAGKVDVVICEGTTLSRSNAASMTEYELSQKAAILFKDNKYVFVVCASTK